MFEDIPETPYGMRKRIQFIYKVIEERIKDAADKKKIKVLDIGCGTGELLTIPLGLLETTMLGIDTHLPSIEYANNKNVFENVGFECTYIDKLIGQQFDFIICSEVLEHQAEPEKMLVSIKKLMKPDGVCIITIPNGYGPKEMEIRLWNVLERLGLTATLKFLKRLVMKIIYKDTIATSKIKDSLATECSHIQFFTYRRFRRLLERSGLSIIEHQNRRFLSGPFSDEVLSRVETLTDWNVMIADKLPYFLVSSWMVVVTLDDRHNEQ